MVSKRFFAIVLTVVFLSQSVALVLHSFTKHGHEAISSVSDEASTTKYGESHCELCSLLTPPPLQLWAWSFALLAFFILFQLQPPLAVPYHPQYNGEVPQRGPPHTL